MWPLIGQERVTSLLDRSLARQTVAHSYLLTGPRHVGKKTLAVAMAQALNCAGSQPPCQQCPACRRILQSKHADVVTLGLGSKTEIGIGDIIQLQHLANLPPYEGRTKTFVVECADYMSAEAANSLLKILEEPPPNVVWILLAVEESRVLPTITSRCLRLELRPLPPALIEQTLITSHSVQSDRARLLARLSEGCIGSALSMMADPSIFQQRKQKVETMLSLLPADLNQRFSVARELASEFSRDRSGTLDTLSIWVTLWRDMMLIKGGSLGDIINLDYDSHLERLAAATGLGRIKNAIISLRSTRQDLIQNVNARLAWESLVLHLPQTGPVD